MGLFSRAFRPVGGVMHPQATAGTAGPYSPLDPELALVLGGGPSRSGVTVGADSALNSASVFACVRVISEDVGTITLHLYRRGPDNTRNPATDDPRYDLLNNQPNRDQTASEWREWMQAQVELRGCAFSRITRVRGEARELIPLESARIAVTRDSFGRNVYKYDGREVPAADVFHLHGYSPVRSLRETIGLEIALERHGALQFGNGARPGGVLQHPQVMSEEAALRLKKQISDASTGENQHRLVLLEEGIEWKQVSLSNEDAQFLETRKHIRSVIAGAFRIPPHLIGDLDRATFTNIEHQGIEYHRSALLGRLRRWEQRLNATLLTPAERRDLYFEFDPNVLLRGDVKARFDAYNQAISGGWLNRNEVRAMENLNKQDGLDEYLAPLNMRGANEEE